MQAALIPGKVYPIEIMGGTELIMFENPVKCGYPAAVQDVVQKPVDLNELLVRNRQTTFVFVAEGSSMEGEHIPEGALVVVDTSVTPRTGHIVLADVDGEYTLKKVDFKLMRLIPANPLYQPIVLHDGMELKICGVVTSIIINPYLPFVVNR
jgi:DNA polymerase V